MKRFYTHTRGLLSSVSCIAAAALLSVSLVHAEPAAIQASVQASLEDALMQTIAKPVKESPVEPTPVELGLGTLSLTSVEGSPLQADRYQDKKVVLYFWSIRCHGCAGPIKELQAMQEELKNNNVELLTVHLFENDRSVLENAFTKLGLRVPIMLAPNAVRDLFKVRLLPTSLVFDSKHKLQTRLDGEIDEENLRLSIFGKAPAELVEKVASTIAQ